MNERDKEITRLARPILRTIQKIEALPPSLGPKWQKGMLAHYYKTLAELTLDQLGFGSASASRVDKLSKRLRRALLLAQETNYDPAFRRILASLGAESLRALAPQISTR